MAEKNSIANLVCIMHGVVSATSAQGRVLMLWECCAEGVQAPERVLFEGIYCRNLAKVWLSFRR